MDDKFRLSLDVHIGELPSKEELFKIVYAYPDSHYKKFYCKNSFTDEVFMFHGIWRTPNFRFYSVGDTSETIYHDYTWINRDEDTDFDGLVELLEKRIFTP
jgi:hypothetical protein